MSELDEIVANRATSILLEDYEAMEKFMKRFLVLAPAVTKRIRIENFEDIDLSLEFQKLQNQILSHLEK